MYSSTKWMVSLLQIMAVIVVIAGTALWAGSRDVDQSVRQATESRMAAPNPETTGSILKVIGR